MFNIYSMRVSIRDACVNLTDSIEIGETKETTDVLYDRYSTPITWFDKTYDIIWNGTQFEIKTPDNEPNFSIVSGLSYYVNIQVMLLTLFLDQLEETPIHLQPNIAFISAITKKPYPESKNLILLLKMFLSYHQNWPNSQLKPQGPIRRRTIVRDYYKAVREKAEKQGVQNWEETIKDRCNIAYNGKAPSALMRNAINALTNYLNSQEFILAEMEGALQAGVTELLHSDWFYLEDV